MLPVCWRMDLTDSLEYDVPREFGHNRKRCMAGKPRFKVGTPWITMFVGFYFSIFWGFLQWGLQKIQEVVIPLTYDSHDHPDRFFMNFLVILWMDKPSSPITMRIPMKHCAFHVFFFFYGIKTLAISGVMYRS